MKNYTINTSSANHLFVYGTLMQCFDNEMSYLLLNSASYMNVGKANGLLYDLGSYPGMVPDPNPTNIVYGEIYSLNPEVKFELLQTLDAYEGITGNNTDEYYRAVIPVHNAEGVVHCNCYLLSYHPIHGKRIPSGNYLQFIKGGM